MNEIEVHMIRLQPLQALLDRRHDAGAAAVPPGRYFVVAHPEFGDDADIPTAAAERASQCLLRHPHPVRFGGVEAGYAIVDRLLDGVLKLALVDPAVRAADFPATEPDLRDLEIGLAELPIFHRNPLLRGDRR